MIVPASEGKGSPKVSRIVAHKILDEIVTEKIPAGTRLALESEMLEQYGVARGTLREALRILETHGLIRMKTGTNGGPIVEDIGTTQFGRSTTFFYRATGCTLRDLLGARLVIEPAMAREAARSVDARAAERMRSTLEAAKVAEDCDGDEWSEANNEFHNLIVGLSGNHVLDLLARSIVAVVTSMVESHYAESQDRHAVRRIHARIAEAIIAGNPDEAERLAYRHVKGIAEEIERQAPDLLDRQVDWL